MTPWHRLALAALLASAPALGDAEAGSQGALAATGTTVVSIGDGDTIRVRKAGRLVTVRLACIDAPELAQAPYGAKARRYL